MSHIFFIHSSVDGHLAGFHVLALMNSAAVSIRVHVSSWIRVSSFLDIRPAVGLQDDMVAPFLDF